MIVSRSSLVRTLSLAAKHEDAQRSESRHQDRFGRRSAWEYTIANIASEAVKSIVSIDTRLTITLPDAGEQFDWPYKHHPLLRFSPDIIRLQMTKSIISADTNHWLD